MTDNNGKKTVLVTGFGPFQNTPINDSWESVKRLWDFNNWPTNIKLITRQLNVVYKEVLDEVPKLWDEFKPDLVIHVGVSGGATSICIEEQSFNDEYNENDITNACPPSNCCCPNGKRCLKTKLDVAQLCSYTNQSCHDVGCSVFCQSSSDPGNYLCGFTYYLSLSKDHTKALFVHVPPSKIFDVESMARALQFIILNSLEQIKHYA